jgi:AcrR family transcriptional regulator
MRVYFAGAVRLGRADRFPPKEDMDNATRSERTRSAVIQASLTIIARDGPSRLTLDAIARESGMSKGGLMHQFRTKEAVLKALLDYQIERFEAFSRDYLANARSDAVQPYLSAQIALLRHAASGDDPVAVAILGAVTAEPGLVEQFREADVQSAEKVRAEAADPDLALLRLTAAKGLLLTSLLGVGSVSPEVRDRLFARLLDNAQWPAMTPARSADRGDAR